MRRKGERDIPDFSSHHPVARGAAQGEHGVTPEKKLSKAQHPSRGPSPKPQATSSKSGRRGS
jgi:hypothetical protein